MEFLSLCDPCGLCERYEFLSQCHFSLRVPCVPCERYIERHSLDAIDWYDPDKEHKALKSEVTKFQKSALSASAETRPSVGLGTDFRLESRKIAGFALALDDQILHMSIFARTDGQKHERQASRMERYTQRRKNRTI